MKRFIYSSIFILGLLFSYQTASALDSNTITITQTAQDVTITAKYTGDGTCNGYIEVTDGKSPPVYSKTTPISFTANNQSKSVKFTGLTKGNTYFTIASCSKSTGDAYRGTKTFVFNGQGIISNIKSVFTDKKATISFNFDSVSGVGINNISGTLTSNEVGMGGGPKVQVLTPTLNPSVGRISGVLSFYEITSLTPNTKYTVTITARAGTVVKETKTATFTTKATTTQTTTTNTNTQTQTGTGTTTTGIGTTNTTTTGTTNNTITRWYFNSDKQIQGPFNSPGECERQMNEYITKNGLTTGGAGTCEQKTTADAEAIRSKQADAPVSVTPQKPPSSRKIYNLLAPIGSLVCIDSSNENPECAGGTLGSYLNTIFKIAIGLCGVLAVIMLVVNFIGYMASESFTEKAKFKEKFWGPIGGLLLALGAYAILVTINPALTGKEGLTVEQVGVTVEDFNDMPEGGDLSEVIYTKSINGTPGEVQIQGIKCATGSETKGFCMLGSYDSPKPTGEIPGLITLLKSGYKISKIHIIPNGKNERFVFTAKKGSDEKDFSTMGIGHGANGFSALGQGREGDKKTPYGNYKIDRPPRKAENQMTVIRSTRKDKNGLGYSMGGAVFNLNSRGIAIHSNRKNSLGTTAACIMMYNDDLFALYPYIWVGLPVVIGP